MALPPEVMERLDILASTEMRNRSNMVAKLIMDEAARRDAKREQKEATCA